jgi:hypothetical protein
LKQAEDGTTVEEENVRRKRLVAIFSLNKEMLQDVIKRKL